MTQSQYVGTFVARSGRVVAYTEVIQKRRSRRSALNSVQPRQTSSKRTSGQD